MGVFGQSRMRYLYKGRVYNPIKKAPWSRMDWVQSTTIVLDYARFA